ncbi:pilus (MSHA type) biogenesis protein MshL [Cellvibrio japonicus]|uniref:MSHA biogenesis protein MshL n=1 Tax=Cellvibrio japonicus (strain Ueda107) TaxID=498211 RepID=B3PKC9_CELJU|nr:pilus (MSHA type) biogenesis protein MshL [Cellvibrio japonicus]ACE82662.1 MSHA biogenesis protein MshL [Cellvibrio japonicus Ueda107]QEI12800.1 pilus (MSHA type) biogenesis protein MshL [Cellvibrio japonicus]QEI16374.1 pilus (MSHA type) biogenesis protein MshL [Cellvibrio japonicus]QEI19952.1 pilus (MSHA type) biogenesis protein MshL [Cellvibrio japonicus]
MSPVTKHPLLPFILLPLLMVLAACSNTRDGKLVAEQELDKAVNSSPATASPPAAVTQSLLQNPSGAYSAPKSAERFDVSVHNVSARDFFLGLVNGTGVNVVVHPGVSGSVTLDLKNVTVDDVLRVTRDIYGYEFKRDRNIYTIYANELRTQVFQINYLDVQRVGVSDTSVLVGRAQSTSNNMGGNTNNSSGSAGDTANLLGMLSNAKEKVSGAGLTPGSRVQTLNRTDFWHSLEKTILSIIGGKEGERSVMISPQAGMVVVKALPHELSSVRDYLERSELSAKRQVILETKILEVRLSEGFEAGVNWGAISGQLGYSYGSGRGTISASDSLEMNYGPGFQMTDATRTITESSEYGGKDLFAGLVQVADITKLLSLLETQGAVQVLSSPRVSTVNNQKAVIRVGYDEYFVTGISSNTTTNAAAITNTPNIELSPFFSGISLDVTPQISEAGEVILHIHPIVSEVTDQLKVFTVGDENFSLPLALRGIRESDSIVKAANGQVIVLGGLMTESNRQTDGKRPLLGDIPIVNSLFRTKNKSKSKTELVILLRPIVVDDTTWDAQLRESRDSMQIMGEAYRNP